MPTEWLLADPERLVKTLLLGSVSYAALIAMLRLSGKRTLAQMNAFDFIITVALGSTLSAILVSPEVSLAQGVLALGLLVALQFLVTFGAVRSKLVARAVKNEPRMLLYRGRLLDDALRRERIAPEEVRQAIRAAGQLSVERVEAVVLETDGTFSVMAQVAGDEPSALADVELPRPD